jgi:hypothetical protein
MKLRSWLKLAFLIVAAVSIAMTSIVNDGGGAAAKTIRPDAPRPATAETGRHERSGTGQGTQALRVELERLARAEFPQEAGQQVTAEGGAGIFGVTSWYVPPPPPPPQPPPPPPKPTAPPLPFSYLGRYQESQAPVIMLVKGERIYTVSAGEVIDNIYRVEGVSNGRVELTYLPLNIKQTLDTGEAS